jgi:glycosyltransferase involved in cell wall biosynthesis
MTNPKFSIIIPTYNRADLIIKTINSVLSQTYQNFEIIVVDNCSTDITKEVLSPFIVKKQIHFIEHDKNYERSKSRNTGMQNAAGDFVTFLDSDDIMYPNNLLDAKNFIDNNKNFHVFHNLYHLINEKGEVVHNYKFLPIKNQLRSISIGNFISCIGVFISKDIYTQFQFDLDPELLGMEDWFFWLNILPKYKIGRINNINNAILQHDERTVKKIDPEDILKKKLYVYNKVLANEYLKESYLIYLRLMKASGYLYSAIIANASEEYNKALLYIGKAVKFDYSILFTNRFLTVLKISLLGKFKI